MTDEQLPIEDVVRRVAERLCPKWLYLDEWNRCVLLEVA